MNDIEIVLSARGIAARASARHASDPDRLITDEAALHDVLFVIVAVAARFARLSLSARDLAPEIAFGAIRGLRNTIVHEPERIERNIIALIARVHLPRLVVDLDRLIDRLETSTAGD